MQRVTRPSAVAAMPPPPVSPGPPGFFTSGDPVTGIPATVPGQEWFNGVQEELAGLIEWAGLAPASGDLTQLRKSVARLAGGNVRTVTANTALAADDAGLVLASAAVGNRVLTLPVAAAAGGRPIAFAIVRTDASANTLTVAAAGGNSIEGGASVLLPVTERLLVTSDGVNGWYVASSRQAIPPIGSSLEWNGSTLPPGYLWENGANVSRATYAALFAVIGTSFGAGDGSTTFGLPDSRGRAAIGRDNMGGTAAGRITAGLSGIAGATLGAAGGDERLHAHGHGIADPGHGHSIADPGHAHGVYDPGHGHVSSEAVVKNIGVPTGFQVVGNDPGGRLDPNNVVGTNASPSYVSIYAAATGIGIFGAGTGIGIQGAGAGASQNVMPSIVKNKIIFTGVY